jgi:hypothetical protein
MKKHKISLLHKYKIAARHLISLCQTFIPINMARALGKCPSRSARVAFIRSQHQAMETAHFHHNVKIFIALQSICTQINICTHTILQPSIVAAKEQCKQDCSSSARSIILKSKFFASLFVFGDRLHAIYFIYVIYNDIEGAPVVLMTIWCSSQQSFSIFNMGS